jgi:transcriptional regulator with XRE-family HTH domain
VAAVTFSAVPGKVAKRRIRPAVATGNVNQQSQEIVYQMNSALDRPVEADLTKKIGQRLRAARHAQGLSLADLSSRTGSLADLSSRTGLLSKSRISNYEQGIRRMGIEEAQDLALALGSVTPTYLLCLEDSDPLSAEERTLVDWYRRADPRGREVVLRIAETQALYGAGKDPGYGGG